MSASGGASNSSLRRVVAAAGSRIPFLVDAYRYMNNPAWERAIRADLARTHRDTEFLRALPSPEPGTPVAVVALYRDNIYDTKVGLILATALRLRGLEPVVLMPSGRGHRIRRYAGSFGVSRVIAIDSVPLTREEHAECATATAALLAGVTDIPSVMGWTFRGRPAGNHVLSTLIRTTFDGSPDLHLDANRDRLAAITQEVVTNYVRSEHLVRDLAPRCVLLEESNYSTNGPLVDVAVAGGIDVVPTITIWRDDALMSKRLTASTRRVDAKSVAPETFACAVEEPWTEVRQSELMADFDRRYGGVWQQGRAIQPGTEARSGSDLVTELGLDPSRPTAVVFAHVLWDATLFYGVDLFENYADWLEQTVAAAAANPRANWVVKAHPSNVFRAAHGDVQGESSEVSLVRHRFPDLPDHVRILLPDTKISTRSLYEFADYAVTVRGTAGLEMACHGKPAFTAGTGNYSGLGFSVDSASAGEYLGRLAAIETYGPLSSEETRRARSYAHALFVRRPWRTRSFENHFDFHTWGWSPLDRNASLTVRSLDELHSAGDLDQWAAWVLDGAELDFLPSGQVSLQTP